MCSRLYFGYGSNLWMTQMEGRCPDSIKVCVAMLPAYRWGISSRGYANVYPSHQNVVYGVLYALSPSDEIKLDGYEGVAHGSYNKVELQVKVKLKDGVEKTHPVLVYIDPRKEEGQPRTEYVMRIRAGLKDAELPSQWVRDNIKPLLPPEEDEEKDDSTY